MINIGSVQHGAVEQVRVGLRVAGAQVDEGECHHPQQLHLLLQGSTVLQFHTPGLVRLILL